MKELLAAILLPILMASLISICGCAGLLTTSIQAAAQEPFEPIPQDLVSEYRFDLARYLFASPEMEKQERKKDYAIIEELEGLKGKVSASAANLERALDLLGKGRSLTFRHVAYYSLRYSTNVNDTLSRDEQSKLAADVNRRLSFLARELRRIDGKALARFVKQRASLNRYKFAIEDYRRQAPHELKPEEAELLATLDPFIQGWTGEFYNRVANQNADWASIENDLSFALIRLVKARNALAQLRRHSNGPAEAYFNQYLSTEEVKGILDQLAKQAELHKRYEQSRVAYLKKITGHDKIRFYADFRGSISGFTPRLTIAQATDAIKNSVIPLGPEYQREMAALLDPANRRMDIAPGPNRAPGGFMSGFPGSMKSVFYAAGFRGALNDVIALAHEAGHGAQFELMAEAGVSPLYANGSDFLKESYGFLNELLLFDHLCLNETDRGARAFYLDRFFERAFQIFSTAWATEFEQSLYEKVGRGEVATAEDLNALMAQTGSRYSIWFAMDEDAKRDWINIPHYFRNPLYRVNYLYARLLALKYYELYKRDPKAFASGYLALQRNGYDAAPDVLLKRFLGIELRGDRFVSDILDILKGRMREMETLYSNN